MNKKFIYCRILHLLFITAEFIEFIRLSVTPPKYIEHIVVMCNN